ncbi:MAG: hypothetical protein A3J65_01180 [Candidatus Buchananbacteria bacterium RIFCSPHIGHO2_02_FULL_45_11b]|uniref:Lipoprotein n=4 Tax=Candidatus Buchananiibacteriota TaxID=1817903 RepID=A0A1G1Y9I2_9BACT|nr:MAG: hypothetical protein A2663_03090 [Candidatus Buchananbacteria bacterium RIFCSPHIGHO2_01_FULL_46_12]OGY51458.1 MAG: hypothetical protein A3J65_01180 [Candidatus Buchananbacteria bacterium RIFCSPHIGHO2_02_FULL_45_11b]OGY53823.1 MAG: hypothetical protein A3B15_00840 [Candidatus Buchananbacteria bacterium RIFCSPLOWO2_01_FULL_45_31]OGY58041.1 MAG: hypothetical protein A3H67_01060 [Candidatus Buchananbacteria bacterium RIFCSPLOWO2_02_FULL_46_11b]
MNTKFITLILLFSLSLSLSACLKAKDRLDFNQNQNGGKEVQPPVLAEAELEQNYQTAVKEALLPYWQKQDISGVKDKILELRAPAKFLDLHFNLVVALELLEQGKAGADQGKIEAGMEKLNVLKTKYPWLSE